MFYIGSKIYYSQNFPDKSSINLVLSQLVSPDYSGHLVLSHSILVECTMGDELLIHQL